MKEGFGASFEDAYECTHPKVDKIINAFGEPHSADVLYASSEIEIFRFLQQTEIGMVRSFKIMYAAQLVGTERYIITCGSIRTSNPEKFPEYEKVGKRKLYKATKELWNIQY